MGKTAKYLPVGFALAVASACSGTRPVHDSSIELTSPLRVDSQPATAARDADKCSAWRYDATRLATDFGKMQEVDSAAWGALCYQYSCSAVGTADLQGEPYNIRVNAGGWITLSSKTRTTRYFIQPASTSSFVDQCNCCEED